MDLFGIVLATKQDKGWINPSFQAFETMMKKYGSFFEIQKEEFIAKQLEYFEAFANSEIIKAMVQYYDLRKENKLDKEILDINPILKFSEHEFNKKFEQVVDVLDEHFDGIEINNEMPIEERIEILRNYDEFDKHLSENDMPKADDLLDVKLNQENIDKFKDKSRYLPQKTLSYREFLAIEKNFKGVDFERSSFLTASLP